MKKLLSGLLSSVLFLGVIAPTIPAHGAGTVTQFEIIAPATVKANEAFDVTVRAIDSEKNVVTSYRGSIIFASALFGDTVPMQGKAIQFTAENNGEKTFSKATSFKDPGQKDIAVVDLNDTDLSGETTVNVLPADGSGGTGPTEPVTIISPEKNTKITGNMLTVSGNTRKNSKVNIKLNDIILGTATSDADGIFTKTISGVTEQNNILSVEVLDANNTVIGVSEKINIEKTDATASIYSVTVSPGTTVEASSAITITVDADPGMSSMNVEFDGVTLPAQEKDGTTEKGKYTLETVAPAKEGTYPINISAVNALGTSTKKDKAAELVVTAKQAPVSALKNVQAKTEAGGRVTFSFAIDNPPADLDKFKIVYGDAPDSYGNEVVTYPAAKILGTDGLYHWYVDRLATKTYYFRVLGIKADGTTIESLASDPINATIGKDGCTIGNVGAISVQTVGDKSVLSWETVPNAISYNIYKVSAAGDQTLFQNVKENKYALHLASGAVTYDDFAIKALCDETTESSTPAIATKVQSGPGSIAFVVIISGMLGAIILRRKAI